MRVGQKNKLTYRWARKGSRPRAIHDQRTQSTYLFGAVYPERGAGAALVLPACNSEAMQLHLDEIATKVTPGAHAIVLLDQAGWMAPRRSRRKDADAGLDLDTLREMNADSATLRDFLFGATPSSFVATPKAVGKRLRAHVDGPVKVREETLVLRRSMERDVSNLLGG